MFVITVVGLVLNLLIAYQAFSVNGLEQPDPSATYFNISSPLSVAKNAVVIALSVISDCIMVYRTYIIWDLRLTVIIFPTMLLLGDVALGILSEYTLSQTPVGSNQLIQPVTIRTRYFFIVTFCLNFLCAALICSKIWHVHSQMPSHVLRVGERSTARAFEVIIETAALYCAHLLILIVTDAVGSNLFLIFLDPLPPITALVFTMLIVRARPAKHHNTHLSVPTFQFWSHSHPPIDTDSPVGQVHTTPVDHDSTTQANRNSSAGDFEGGAAG